MTNKILMVGVLDVPSSTNVFMAKGFEQLGYEVEAYNYRTRAKKRGSDMIMWEDFKGVLNNRLGHFSFYPPRLYSLIVFCKTNSMHPELLNYAKKAGPTWYWFMDPKVTANACIAQEYAKCATYASATSSEVVNSFKEANDNSYHLIEGYDPDIYFYEDLEKIYDVTFIGNATPKRIEAISSLGEAIDNKQIHIFGRGWPMGLTYINNVNPPVYNEKERRVINQSKIVLNLCQDDTMFSDRVIKSLGCGAVVLSQNCKDLANFNKKTITFLRLYDDVGMAKFISHLYITSGPTKRVCKEVVGYMKENYSWKAVCKSIMEKVDGK